MVKKLTSIAVTTIGILFNTFTTAGTMGTECVAVDVTIPCEEQKWNLSVDALYLRPVISTRGLDYKNSADMDITIVEPADSKWGWGYRLQGSYEYGQGNDFGIEWLHFNENTHDPITRPGMSFTGESTFHTKIIDKFDRVNVIAGQFMDILPLQRSHFYAGLQYGDINHEYINDYALNLKANYSKLTSIRSYEKAYFSGIGPVVGADFAYGMPWGLKATADFNGSLLYGTSRTMTGVILGPSGAMKNQANFSTKRVVAGIDTKVGLDYAHDLASGILHVFGGYEALNYFHAFALPSNMASSINSNYGLFGPYLGLRWTGFA